MSLIVTMSFRLGPLGHRVVHPNCSTCHTSQLAKDVLSKHDRMICTTLIGIELVEWSNTQDFIRCQGHCINVMLLGTVAVVRKGGTTQYVSNSVFPDTWSLPYNGQHKCYLLMDG